MAQPVEHGREPCPDRILDDIGGAFGMGAVGGGIWQMYKGLRNSPKGYKLSGAIENIRRESPRIGGSFANWGLMFSIFDCTFMYLRKKEDPFNAIMAGAATGGFLSLRSGLRPAFRSAVVGGMLLAAIEGVGIALQKSLAPPAPSMPMPVPGMDPMAMPPAGPGAGPPMSSAVPLGGSSSSGINAIGGEAGSSGSSSGGGWFSWLSGDSEAPAPAQTTTGADLHHIPDEGFQPTDFKGEQLKH